MRRLALVAAFAVLATPVSAQLMYNGWDLGPDYGEMLRQKQLEIDAFNRMLAERERQVIQQAMADPLCTKLFEGHQQQGGQMDHPSFAYLCWATQYFTPEGIAYFQQVERDNWKKERLALIDLRKMEAVRGDAQNTLNNTIANNDSKLGGINADSATVFDPFSKQNVVLPTFSEPNERLWDAQQQRWYTMNAGGTYFVWHEGAWHELQVQKP